MIVAWLVGCAAEVPAAELPVTVADLWSGALETGLVTLGPVVVTSPRSAAGGAFWVQDPGGGPSTGLRVDVAGFQTGVPPPIGTEVTIVGPWSVGADSAPSISVDSDADVRSEETFGDVVALSWTGDPLQIGSPVVLGLVTVTSGVDPAGEADVAGVRIRSAFGTFVGGWAERAEAGGIALAGDEVAPRGPEDWVVRDAALPTEEVGLADLDGVAEGTPVRVVGVVQSAPWSDDGRWTAVQGGGAGVWIDREGRGEELTAEGDVATWEGEVRRGTDGVRLRVWLSPEVTGVGEVVTGAELAEGARVALSLSGLGEPDLYGARSTTEGVAVDDRFTALDALPDPVLATGVVRRGADGALQLAPFAW